MYPIETKIAPKQSWFTPSEAKTYYGKYARDGITIHWWGGGEPASAHDSIVNYFMSQGQQAIKSVNYVVSDIKITKMVEPDNVAWASQSGNPTTVSFECQPTLTDEGYKRVGFMINEMEKLYGKTLTIYPHNHWFQTSCPGTLDLARMRTEADKLKGNKMYPNSGDLTNFYNDTGWPGHVPNSNDIAYWTTGTGNPDWSKGADQVWKNLNYEISKYVAAHPKTAEAIVLKPGTVYKTP